MKTRCSKLATDKQGQMYCRSTHVCYKTVCMSDMFCQVRHEYGRIVLVK